MYLYGFPQIETEGDTIMLDSSTLNLITVAMGVMFGVAKASSAIKALAASLANGVSQQLMKKALTKTVIYKIAKSISKWFGIKLSKTIFTESVKKAIPLIGATISGTVTYFSFEICCKKLKESLEDTKLSNLNYVFTQEDKEIYDAIVTGETIEDYETNDISD